MILTGKNAENFGKAIFKPSKEYIAESRSQVKRISKQISITKTDDGFNAEINDIDSKYLK